MCLGLILATGAFAICNVWYSSRAGMVFALLFLMVSFLKLDFNASILRWGINIVWACILAVVICIFPTIVMLQSFEYPLAKHFEWNVICVLAVVMVLFTITAKWKLSVGLATFSLYLLSTIKIQEWVSQAKFKMLPS